MGFLADAWGYRPVIFGGLLCREAVRAPSRIVAPPLSGHAVLVGYAECADLWEATRGLLLFGEGVTQMALMQVLTGQGRVSRVLLIALPRPRSHTQGLRRPTRCPCAYVSPPERPVADSRLWGGVLRLCLHGGPPR
jgi:hypothetical protein